MPRQPIDSESENVSIGACAACGWHLFNKGGDIKTLSLSKGSTVIFQHTHSQTCQVSMAGWMAI